MEIFEQPKTLKSPKVRLNLAMKLKFEGNTFYKVTNKR